MQRTMAKKSQKKNAKNANGGGTIALNKRARHEFKIEDKFEAGMQLQGWEVKSLREGKVNIAESYVFLKNGEAYVSGLQILPLKAASTHVVCEPTRVRKLLLNRRELDKLIGAVERSGYTLVATAMYWSKSWVKLEIGLAKGKQAHDKRADAKDREWKVDKQRIMKHSQR